jgi:predicted transcriptional regulator
MFTTRLPLELEAQLDHYAMSTGHAKNSIVALAVAQFLKTVDLSQMPLQEPVQETDFDRHVRRTEEKVKLYANAHVIADWVRTNSIWTKDRKKAMSGAITPGIYGRNTVVGFTDSFRPDGKNSDDKLYVISRNLASVGLGTDSHHLYMTEWHDWNEYMVMVSPGR